MHTLLRVCVYTLHKKNKAKRMRLRHRVQCTELRVHWPQKQGTLTLASHTRTHTLIQGSSSHGHTLVVSSLTSKRITDNRHTHRHTRTYNTCSSQPLRAKRKSVTFSAHAISLAQQSRLLHVTYQAAFVACCAPIELTSHDAKFAERMYIFHI